MTTYLGSVTASGPSSCDRYSRGPPSPPKLPPSPGPLPTKLPTQAQVRRRQASDGRGCAPAAPAARAPPSLPGDDASPTRQLLLVYARCLKAFRNQLTRSVATGVPPHTSILYITPATHRRICNRIVYPTSSTINTCRTSERACPNAKHHNIKNTLLCVSVHTLVGGAWYLRFSWPNNTFIWITLPWCPQSDTRVPEYCMHWFGRGARCWHAGSRALLCAFPW